MNCEIRSKKKKKNRNILLESEYLYNFVSNTVNKKFCSI